MNDKIKQNIRSRFGGYDNATDAELLAVLNSVPENVRVELRKVKEDANSNRPKPKVQSSTKE